MICAQKYFYRTMKVYGNFYLSLGSTNTLTQGNFRTLFRNKTKKAHGNFHVTLPNICLHVTLQRNIWQGMEISIYRAICHDCFMARYMEISMYLPKCLYARLRQSMWQGMEISMYLAICYLARYMEISTYLACPMFHRKVHGNFHVPCQMFACEIATKHMASYGNFHVPNHMVHCKVHKNFNVPCQGLHVR